MSEITRVGVDLAKHVIQVHGVDNNDKLIINRALPRDKFLAWCSQLPAGCMIAMEACTGAHHWARQLQTMRLDARIIAAHLVAPYRLQGTRVAKTMPTTPRLFAKQPHAREHAFCAY